MSNSRWSKWSSGSGEQKLGFGKFLKEADQVGGNHTAPGSGETPAQKAKRLGLVSDGHGAYADPKSGQIVAKTINGELVFYDQGAGGGATSDGEGGTHSPQVHPPPPIVTPRLAWLSCLLPNLRPPKTRHWFLTTFLQLPFQLH